MPAMQLRRLTAPEEEVNYCCTSELWVAVLIAFFVGPMVLFLSVVAVINMCGYPLFFSPV